MAFAPSSSIINTPGHRILIPLSPSTSRRANVLFILKVLWSDISETMITEARKRADGLNLPVEYNVADAQWLDFIDNTFDRRRACRVLIHIENPSQCLAEIVHGVRSRGRIVAFDPDRETTVIDVPARKLTPKITNFW